MTLDSPNRTWIGLFEVRQGAGVAVLGYEQAGAYVNVLALSNDADEYKALVSASLLGLGLEVISCEDVEPFSQRIRRGRPDDSLVQIAGTLSENNRVDFGAFHVFPLEDEGAIA